LPPLKWFCSDMRARHRAAATRNQRSALV